MALSGLSVCWENIKIPSSSDGVAQALRARGLNVQLCVSLVSVCAVYFGVTSLWLALVVAVLELFEQRNEPSPQTSSFLQRSLCSRPIDFRMTPRTGGAVYVIWVCRAFFSRALKLLQFLSGNVYGGVALTPDFFKR